MRKKAHEDHANHEAWAIPYGDLVTLLLALFVVLYSMSSVNEGKYRVLSDSLNEAFGGRPRSPRPIQIGDHETHGANVAQRINVIARRGAAAANPNDKSATDLRSPGVDFGLLRSLRDPANGGDTGGKTAKTNLQHMADDVQSSMRELIDRKLVVVRQNAFSLEIEIRTDILFPSGVAQLSDAAQPVLAKVSASLRPYPNPIRIEGHTDNMPISTTAFPSNWQLSAARAASVVALFMQNGVDPTRMIVAGFGEYHPVASNDTADGRNRNRRVLIVVLGDKDTTITADAGDAAAAALAADERGADAAPAEASANDDVAAVGPLARLQNPVETAVTASRGTQ